MYSPMSLLAKSHSLTYVTNYRIAGSLTGIVIIKVNQKFRHLNENQKLHAISRLFFKILYI